MMNIYSKAYADVYYILSALEEEYANKIPSDLIDFFKENSEPHHFSTIDLAKPLTEQEISEETEQLICLLNLNYWCTPEEKEELLKKYEMNEKEAEEQLRNTYEIKFNKNAKIEEVKAIAVIKKETIFLKIKKFLRRLIIK